MTTADYRALGVHQVNAWVWHCLQRDLPQHFTAYTSGLLAGMVPIVPSNQTPETNNIEGGAPYIVYTYTLTGAVDEWWTRAENGVYILYDDNEPRLRTIHNYLIDLLRRIDHSATEINEFMGPQSAFDIKSLQLTGGGGADPAGTEGGRLSAILTWRVDYTIDIDGRTVTNLNDPTGMRL